MDDYGMSAGFYKFDEQFEQLYYGPNYVLNMDFELRAESHEDHEYPVGGWYWFDSEEEAREALGLPPATESNGV